MASVDTRMITEAQATDGLITLARLEKVGLSSRGRRTRVTDARLQPVVGGVFLLGGYALTWERRVWAAQMATGGVVSHMAAAAVHGFRRIGPGSIEITVAYGRSARLPGGKVHRSKSLEPVDIDNSRRFAVTTPERTLLDIALRLSNGRLERCFDDACRQGLIDKRLLRGRLEALAVSGRRGTSEVTSLLNRPNTDTVLESWLERRAAEIVGDSQLPEGRWQVWSTPDGRATRVDLFYDFAALVVEFDGHGSHATRRERQADAERMARLTAQGMCVLRFTYDDIVERPDHVVATIERHLALRMVS